MTKVYRKSDGSQVVIGASKSASRFRASAVAAQVAQFGNATIAGEGGFKPLVNEAEVDLVSYDSLVSGSLGAYTPSISGGRLVFDATGAPDGAVLRCSTASGTVDITISQITGKSVATASELAVALFNHAASGSGALTIYVRPVLLDLSNGGGNGIFHQRTFTASNPCTVTKHPNSPVWRGTNRSLMYDTQYLTVEEFRFERNVDGAGDHFLIAGKGAGSGTRYCTIQNGSFIGSAPTAAQLVDTADWATGAEGQGIKLAYPLDMQNANTYGMTYRNLTMTNVYWAGNYYIDGPTLMDGITIDTVYYDGVRLTGPGASGSEDVKVFRNISLQNAFGKNNENTGGTAPHLDVIQWISGGQKNCVFDKIVAAKGPYRADVMQMLQTNARMFRSVWHRIANTNKSSPWGWNPEGGTDLVVSQSTFIDDDLTSSTQLRVGNPLGSAGRIVLQNIACRDIATLANTTTIDATDPGTLETINSQINTDFTAQISGSSTPATAAARLLALAPVAGSTLDTAGQGAIGDGDWRDVSPPPLHGPAPTVTALSATSLRVTPGESYGHGNTDLAQQSIASMHLFYKESSASSWTVVEDLPVTGGTGDVYDITGLTSGTSYDVAYRYVGANGLIGPKSIETVQATT